MENIILFLWATRRLAFFPLMTVYLFVTNDAGRVKGCTAMNELLD